MPTNIDDLSIRITSDADQAVNAIDRLSNSLLNLKSSAKLTSAINNISKLSNALNGISNSKGLSGLNALSGTIQNLSNNVSKSLTSSINAINRLPKSINALDDTKIEQLGSAFSKLNEMIKPLAKTIAPIQSGLQSLATIATRGVSGLNSISVAATKTYKSFSIFGNLKGLIGLIPWKIMIDSIGKAINSTNSYIENLNLFRVAMGENYDEAYEYAMLLQDKMGIDAGEFMRNQGIIQSMANGFGIAKDQAYQFSKGMTEFAYDLSSFFNIDIETAMQKVESGIAGEIEPLRRLGFALSEASLQQVAYEHGINKSIRSMTEAEKAQIRYTAIVEQASQMGAIGDFAKTLESPANALRILQQQIIQLARAIGSVFIPILTKVLPYIQAFVSIVTDAIRALASLVGFELPDWGGSSWSAAESGSAAVADNMGAAAANAKKMGDNIQGFDELNTMDKDTGSGSGGGVSGGGGGMNMDLASVWDEAVIAGIETQVDSIVKNINSAFMTVKDTLIDVWNTDAVQSFVDYAEEALNFTKDLVVSLGTNLWNNLLTSWGNAQTNISQGLTNIVTLFTIFWQDMTEGIQTWGQPIIDGVTNIFNTIWLDIIDPAIQGISQLWNDFTEMLLNLWEEHGERLVNNIGEFVTKTIELFQSIWDNVIDPIIKPFLEMLSELWNNHLKYVVDDVLNFVNNLINSALEIYNKFIVPIITWLQDKLAPVWEFLNKTVFSVMGGILNTITDVIGNIVGIFNGIVNFITGVFTGDWEKAWDGVVQIFSNIFDGLGNIVKAPINAVIKVINWAIDRINDVQIHFDLPFGLGRVDWNGLQLKHLQYLAQGGYIEANSPQLAVIGDNRRYGEIVAPENKLYDITTRALKASDYTRNENIAESIKQALIEALEEADINQDIYLDGVKVTKQIAKNVRQLERTTGRNVIFG